MTSLFDQFEQPSMKTRNNNFSQAEMSSSGYINMSSLLEETPIFVKQKKDFSPPDKVTHVAISNKQLIVAMANNALFRINLHNPTKKDEIPLGKYTATCRLTNLFLDPTGNHLLLAFAAKVANESVPELLYLSRKSNKLKSTTKFRGHEFTEVAWNALNESENTTGPILLGTSKGLIFETEIVLEGDKFFTSGFSSSLEQYWRQVFDIGKNTNTPITGLYYYKLFSSDKYGIFASTPTRLYYFIGNVESNDEKPLLQQIFNKYLNIPEKDTFIEIESNLRYSRLKFWSENLTTPNKFAWMTEKGITYSTIDSNDNISTFKAKMKLISYPKPLYEDYSVSPKFPIAIALTEFHILLAYTDTIKGLCLLNEEVVYEDNYNEAFGKLVNIVKDPLIGDIWAVAENAVFRFKITKEERNVWQIFCDNQQFDLAKKYSRGNEAFYNQVLIKEADKLFQDGKYEESAQCYAETQSSFEEICLKFIQIEQQDSLKMFLRLKLDTLKAQDKTQITMIVLWLVELYLNKLEELRLNDLEQSANYLEIQKEFELFLALDEVSDCIRKNKTSIYELMASHGDKSNLIKLTIVNKDFEQLIRQHIYKNSFHEALEVLKSQNNYDLYYQFAPILIQEVPKYTIKALINQGKKLQALKLLPALVVACQNNLHAKEVIKYLEFSIDTLKNSDKAIHNFLLTLYVKFEPHKLMDYLNSQGQELTMVNYDVYFALRLCQENNLTEACVQLSAILGLWETAVELALTINLNLAKQLADMPPENDVELRRKLWLKIAKHVVSDNNDIEKAMEFLKQCDLIRIEDILPFFSDFVTIDHFKEAICNSLKQYNQHIQDLKQEMEEATQSAEQVRNEIQSFRNRCTFLNANETCDICNNILMVRPFYIFPCQHKFHTKCLLNELCPLLGPAKKNKLTDLERQLKILSQQIDNVSTGSGMSTKDVVKSEIDNIVASECLFCGENMIRNIDKPFIENYEYDKIKKEWE